MKDNKPFVKGFAGLAHVPYTSFPAEFSKLPSYKNLLPTSNSYITLKPRKL